MAWEERGRSGRLYLYRSVREGGRVRKEYVGTGELAELLAQLREKERARQRERARVRRLQVAAVLEGEETAAALDRAASVLIRASLYAAGYRRHKRGEWRRPRPARPRPSRPSGANGARRGRRAHR